MFDKFHDIIGGIHVPVDDGVDKLNRKYTLLVFLFLALPIFTKQYIGDPIECFAPVYFAEHQSRYINSYCWTQSTYYMVPVGDPEDDGDQQEPPDRIMPDEVDYFIGFETVTHIGNERLRRVRVSYYQWAPLILLAQGLCFYIPFLIWNSCANNAGVKLRRLLKKASDIASLPPGCQQREALLAEFVDQFHTLVTGEAGWCADLQCGGSPCGPAGSAGGSSGGSSASGSSGGSSGANGPAATRTGRAGGAPGTSANADDPTATGGHSGHGHRGAGHSSHHNSSSQGCCLVSIPIIGSLLACCLKPCAPFGLVGPSKYLCLLYLAVKFAYVFNVGLQFFLLGQFLGRGYLRHGLELINRLIVNGEWWASPRFPLSTLCQVRADMSGGLRSYTCQCVLPINVFNEKIFSVVWFYMAFLLPLNVLSLLFWIYRTFETNRISYIRLCLWRTRLVELSQIHRTVRRLSQSYLGWDGVFLLRLIEHNHGSIMATLIMSRLWEFYANQMKLQEDANQLALANNAQHTLSNITTAISNQHQLLAAAAAQQQQQQQHHQSHHQAHQHQQAIHSHQHQHGPIGSHAGPGHGHGHGGAAHAHHGPPLVGQHGGGAGHFGGAHGPPGAAPPAHVHAHGPHPPLQPSQAPAGHFGSANQQTGGQMPPPMVPHGQHAHHSGQISQAPGHHPLHAANTAAAHHAHSAAPNHHMPPGGPHLSGAFTGANASLLAQLHQHQGQPHGAAPAANQQAAGNVAAAVAALAAAAAAATNNQPGTTTTTTNNNNTSSNNTNSATTGAGSVSATTGAVPAASQSAASAQASSKSSSSSSAIHHHPTIHLHSLMQPASGSPASAAQTSGGQQQASTTQAIQSGAGSQQQQQSQPVGGATSGAGSGSGQPVAAANSATTSFITAATSGQPGPGPPLPPPPPAHVVAAVAAGAVSGAASTQTNAGSAPGSARTGATGLVGRPGAGQPATTNGLQQQQTGPTSGGAQSAPLTNPILFNLKSSSLQAAGQAQNNNNQARFAPHSAITKR